MAGFVEAWGRGYELITEAFTKERLEVPTIEEEFGGVRVIVKREITERQRLIYELLPFGITKDDTKNEPITTARLARQFGKSSSTIKRDMKALQDLGLVTHIGPSNGGYWKRLK